MDLQRPWLDPIKLRNPSQEETSQLNSSLKSLDNASD